MQKLSVPLRALPPKRIFLMASSLWVLLETAVPLFWKGEP